MLNRGDTSTFLWELDTELDFTDVADIWFTMSTPLKSKTWTLNDLVVDAENKTVEYTLTEKESLYFNSGEAEVQLFFLTNDGQRLSTDIFKVNIGRVLNGGEMNGSSY